MEYKEIISQINNTSGKVTNVNIITGTEPLQVTRELARCFRDASPRTCEVSRVMHCKAWIKMGQDGERVYCFRFLCSGVRDINYLYEYEFRGCLL